MARLTPTSYAILGYLAARSWSAYELTKQMRAALRLSWVRTEARIYAEPKNRVERGLATAEEEEHNGRRRSVYTITEEGRDEFTANLRQMVSRPSRDQHFEDAVAALQGIGFSEKEARKSVERAAQEVGGADVELLVRTALAR